MKFVGKHLCSLALCGLLLTFAAENSWAQEQGPHQSTPPPAGRGEFEMVLIHGLGSSAAVWDETKPYLEGTFKVFTFELAGHGQTQPVHNPSITEEVQRLGEFLKANDIVYPTLVGHGLGGMIALQFALEHPADIHRLIVIDTAPRQMATEEDKAHVADALMKNYDRFVAKRYLNMSVDQSVSQEVMDMALRTDSASFISLLMSSFDFDLTKPLQSLSVPLLVIGSEFMFPDPGTSQQVLQELGWANARSLTFKRIDHSGHYVMLERPVYTASVLLAFGVTAEYQFED